MIEIGIEHPDQPEVRALLAASDAYMASLYPEESNHLLDVSALTRPEVTFIVARSTNGAAVGCGAVVRAPGEWAEIKRMFVSPLARGRKIGRRLLERLETIAAEGGASRKRSPYIDRQGSPRSVLSASTVLIHEAYSWKSGSSLSPLSEPPSSVRLSKR